MSLMELFCAVLPKNKNNSEIENKEDDIADNICYDIEKKFSKSERKSKSGNRGGLCCDILSERNIWMN